MNHFTDTKIVNWSAIIRGGKCLCLILSLYPKHNSVYLLILKIRYKENFPLITV